MLLVCYTHFFPLSIIYFTLLFLDCHNKKKEKIPGFISRNGTSPAVETCLVMERLEGKQEENGQMRKKRGGEKDKEDYLLT